MADRPVTTSSREQILAQLVRTNVRNVHHALQEQLPAPCVADSQIADSEDTLLSQAQVAPHKQVITKPCAAQAFLHGCPALCL